MKQLKTNSYSPLFISSSMCLVVLFYLCKNKGGYELVFNCFIDIPKLRPEVGKIMRNNIIQSQFFELIISI